MHPRVSQAAVAIEAAAFAAAHHLHATRDLGDLLLMKKCSSVIFDSRTITYF